MGVKIKYLSVLIHRQKMTKSLLNKLKTRRWTRLRNERCRNWWYYCNISVTSRFHTSWWKVFCVLFAPASLALLGKTQTYRADEPLPKAQENFWKEQMASEKNVKTYNSIINSDENMIITITWRKKMKKRKWQYGYSLLSKKLILKMMKILLNLEGQI